MHAMNEPFNYPDSSYALGGKPIDNLTNESCITNDLVNRFGTSTAFSYKDMYEEVCTERDKLKEEIKHYRNELDKTSNKNEMLKNIIRDLTDAIVERICN